MTFRLPNLTLCVALPYFCLAATAQQPTAPDPAPANQTAAQAPPDTRPAARKRITLDVLVTDHSGKAIAGLEPFDFTILDNGVKQKVQSFRRAEAANQAAATQAEPPPELILIQDRINTGYQNTYYDRKNIEKFLARNDGKLAQPTSIILVTDTETKMQPHPTRDGNALAKALAEMPNPLHSLPTTSGFAGDIERVQHCLVALNELAVLEATRPGRKMVLWIGPGWPAMARNNGDADDKDRKNIFDSILLLSARLREARITLYNVDSGGSPYYEAFLKPVLEPKKALQANLLLQVLAVQSGGRVYTTGNDITSGIDKSVADLDAWYTLTFDAPLATHANEFHQLEVKTTTPGLTTHTFHGYYSQP